MNRVFQPFVFVNFVIGHIEKKIFCKAHARAHEHGAGAVFLFEDADHFFAETDGFFRADLGDLVADGIQDDAGMIVVFCRHFAQNKRKFLVKRRRKVVSRLHAVPHIEGFIHDEKTRFVARFQERGRHGMMRRANGVEARLLYLLSTAELRLPRRDTAQNAVVAVDAAAAEERSFAVDKEAFLRAPG